MSHQQLVIEHIQVPDLSVGAGHSFEGSFFFRLVIWFPGGGEKTGIGAEKNIAVENFCCVSGSLQFAIRENGGERRV